jgi:hypothetical protein
MTAPKRAIRPASHFGTYPLCKGRSALPDLRAMSRTFLASRAFAVSHPGVARLPPRWIENPRLRQTLNAPSIHPHGRFDATASLLAWHGAAEPNGFLPSNQIVIGMACEQFSPRSPIRSARLWVLKSPPARKQASRLAPRFAHRCVDCRACPNESQPPAPGGRTVNPWPRWRVRSTGRRAPWLGARRAVSPPRPGLAANAASRRTYRASTRRI